MTELERCLRAGRKAKKLTQGELAKMAGVERGDIISLESGIFAALDNEALCRIATATEIDEKMFHDMYWSAFRQELKALRTKLDKDNSNAGTLSSSPVRQEAAIPDLADLEKAIMAVPQETRTSLISTIRMLIRAAAVTAI